MKQGITLVTAIRTNNIPQSELPAALLVLSIAVANMKNANFYTYRHTDGLGCVYEVERKGKSFLINRKIRTP